MTAWNFDDKTGRKYGRLTIIKRAKTRSNDRKVCWICRCVCGKETVVTGGNLRSGQVRSCGCSRKGVPHKWWVLPSGEAAFNETLSHMKKNARNKGLEWGLTKEQVRKLTKQNCTYCGIEPKQSLGNKALNGDYLYNGIDRVDSSRGYELGNVVSCCKACNYAKRKMSVDEFKQWAIALYKNWASKDEQDGELTGYRLMAMRGEAFD